MTFFKFWKILEIFENLLFINDIRLKSTFFKFMNSFIASGSRSIPTIREFIFCSKYLNFGYFKLYLLRISREWPPLPRVASTMRPSLIPLKFFKISFKKTGRCFIFFRIAPLGLKFHFYCTIIILFIFGGIKINFGKIEFCSP